MRTSYKSGAVDICPSCNPALAEHAWLQASRAIKQAADVLQISWQILAEDNTHTRGKQESAGCIPWETAGKSRRAGHQPAAPLVCCSTARALPAGTGPPGPTPHRT